MLEDLLKVDIPDSYDSIVTVVTMIVLFYGAAFLKDAAVKLAEDGALRRQVNNLIKQLAERTGKSPDEIRKALDAKYASPGPVKRLTKAVHGFFLPSQREGGVPILFDRERVEPEVIKEVPYAEEFDQKEDFERYESHSGVTLEIHAQDRDKNNTGWAAVPKGCMGHALKVSDTISTHASVEGGRRATSAYISSVASDLREIFKAGNAFRQWEVDAIVNSVVTVLKQDGRLSRESLSGALHSRGIPKDLSDSLAEVLSR